MTDVAPSVHGVGKVTTPVNVGLANGAKAVDVYALLPSVPPPPTASVAPSVEVSVRVLEIVAVLPSATASVELVAGAVIAILLIDVAVATPRDGVVSVMLVAASPDGSVVDSDGVLDPFVTSTELAAGVISPRVPVGDAPF